MDASSDTATIRYRHGHAPISRLDTSPECDNTLFTHTLHPTMPAINPPRNAQVSESFKISIVVEARELLTTTPHLLTFARELKIVRTADGRTNERERERGAIVEAFFLVAREANEYSQRRAREESRERISGEDGIRQMKARAIKFSLEARHVLPRV